MRWLRNVFSGSVTHTPKPTKANTFRPNLEALDSREMPSVSSALTATGNLVTYIVDSADNLLVSIDGGAPVLGISGGVRTAQALQTPGGSFGVDIVYLDGRWQHFENPTGTPGLFANITGPFGGTVTAAQLVGVPSNGQILDVATAYDSQGGVRLDILVGTNGGGLDQTGRVFEFNTLALGTGGFVPPGGGSFIDAGLGDNVRWISDYRATNGMTGLAWGTVSGGTLGTPTTPGTGMLQAFKFDVVDGFKVLYQGLDQAGGGITEYSQTVAPVSTTTTTTTPPPPPRVVVDITYDADTAFSTTFDPSRSYSLSFDSASSVTATISVFTRTFVFGGNVVKPGG